MTSVAQLPVLVEVPVNHDLIKPIPESLRARLDVERPEPCEIEATSARLVVGLK